MRAEPTEKTPYIVVLGGALRPNSSTEKALRLAAAAAEKLGAKTKVFAGPALDLPFYAPEKPERSAEAEALVAELRKADGIIIGSPGYHGSFSGYVKNVLDYVEDMSKDAEPYFKGRAVGIIATGAGWQGAVGTLQALRNVVHALRGWPTPFGLAINTIEGGFDAEGQALTARLQAQIEMLAGEVVEFAMQRQACRLEDAAGS
ncbi:NADPH-dependent FMN reductase [Henriciella aquimarina]|uniref:NADPH-dependent FMN reductase n=1 Tax=Henriciella aquimarina TaxID=545261 RepID=UPI0009FC2739|nr:NAD(P)H-dependent oxidoreductase [Henriciella aquimarina]